MIAIDLDKQQALDVDPKAIQQKLILEEVEETVLDSSQGTVELLNFYFCFDIILT